LTRDIIAQLILICFGAMFFSVEKSDIASATLRQRPKEKETRFFEKTGFLDFIGQ